MLARVPLQPAPAAWSPLRWKCKGLEVRGAITVGSQCVGRGPKLQAPMQITALPSAELGAVLSARLTHLAAAAALLPTLLPADAMAAANGGTTSNAAGAGGVLFVMAVALVAGEAYQRQKAGETFNLGNALTKVLVASPMAAASLQPKAAAPVAKPAAPLAATAAAPQPAASLKPGALDPAVAATVAKAAAAQQATVQPRAPPVAAAAKDAAPKLAAVMEAPKAAAAFKAVAASNAAAAALKSAAAAVAFQAATAAAALEAAAAAASDAAAATAAAASEAAAAAAAIASDAGLASEAAAAAAIVSEASAVPPAQTDTQGVESNDKIRNLWRDWTTRSAVKGDSTEVSAVAPAAKVAPSAVESLAAAHRNPVQQQQNMLNWLAAVWASIWARLLTFLGISSSSDDSASPAAA